MTGLLIGILLSLIGAFVAGVWVGILRGRYNAWDDIMDALHNTTEFTKFEARAVRRCAEIAEGKQ